MSEDEYVTRREMDAYKHATEMQRESDGKAFQSQISGIGSVMATHFEDDRRNFTWMRNMLWGLLAMHLTTLGGIITVLITKGH